MTFFSWPRSQANFISRKSTSLISSQPVGILSGGAATLHRRILAPVHPSLSLEWELTQLKAHRTRITACQFSPAAGLRLLKNRSKAAWLTRNQEYRTVPRRIKNPVAESTWSGPNSLAGQMRPDYRIGCWIPPSPMLNRITNHRPTSMPLNVTTISVRILTRSRRPAEASTSSTTYCWEKNSQNSPIVW